MKDDLSYSTQEPPIIHSNGTCLGKVVAMSEKSLVPATIRNSRIVHIEGLCQESINENSEDIKKLESYHD